MEPRKARHGKMFDAKLRNLMKKEGIKPKQQKKQHGESQEVRQSGLSNNDSEEAVPDKD